MTQKGPMTVVVSLAVLGMGVGLVLERQARTRLDGALASLQAEVQRLSEAFAAQQQEIARRDVSGAQSTPPPHGQLPELKPPAAELARLRDRITELESANAAVSNQLAAASGASIPFVYSDSVKRKDYAFSGYDAPQSALHSMLWALSQSDPRAYQASVTDETADAFASAVKDLPEGVMPGGYKNGALFRASGFRILEETSVSDSETRLKVFLEGRHLVLKLVFRKVDREWKMARTEF